MKIERLIFKDPPSSDESYYLPSKNMSSICCCFNKKIIGFYGFKKLKDTVEDNMKF